MAEHARRSQRREQQRQRQGKTLQQAERRYGDTEAIQDADRQVALSRFKGGSHHSRIDHAKRNDITFCVWPHPCPAQESRDPIVWSGVRMGRLMGSGPIEVWRLGVGMVPAEGLLRRCAPCPLGCTSLHFSEVAASAARL